MLLSRRLARAGRSRKLRASPATTFAGAGTPTRSGSLRAARAGRGAGGVVWSGDPISVYARADVVFIEGKRVYDGASPELFPVSDFDLGIGVQP
mgnify:CR=1 FL=1